MKKLINQPEHVVHEMLDGLLALYPGLSRVAGHNVLVRSDYEHGNERQVALISGGGSGHEPAHAGYVGAGMLSAAVAGEVFTSPTTATILAAIRTVARAPGALLIVKNYTGDRLNFGVAAEMARAQGFLIETVLVADDVAVAASEENAGPRGIAGAVLIHKIAGAAAAQEKGLSQVASIARAAAQNIGTMGVSLSAGTSPAVGKPSFTLGDEVELGLGIHGEPGVRRMPMRPADELVDELLNGIVPALQLHSGERVAVLLNNLGATTSMELAIVARRALEELKSRSLAVERFYSGTFMSSLDMSGVSISLLRLDDERLRLLDAPTAAPAWPNVLPLSPGSVLERTIRNGGETPRAARPGASSPPHTARGKLMAQAIAAACAALIDAEDLLTEMDRLVGDGDLGINMARAAKAVLDQLQTYPLDDPCAALKALGITMQDFLGGSSGPLYGVFLLRAANTLAALPIDAPDSWATAMTEACNAVTELGGARAGDRTMLDALLPFAATLHNQAAAGEPIRSALIAAAGAAGRGADNTSNMIARRGRSSYLGKRVVGHPDPGAVAAAIWLRAAASVVAG